MILKLETCAPRKKKEKGKIEEQGKRKTKAICIIGLFYLIIKVIGTGLMQLCIQSFKDLEFNKIYK